MMCIAKDTVVAMRYIMRNSKDLVLEDTMNVAPISYLHGAGSIHPLLQAQLEGLKSGARKMVYLQKESGLTDDDFSFEVIVDSVRAALPEEVLLGYPVKIDTDNCDIDCACYG
jgi:FKBP-type peptidyl-prolyl cis-trans isomerase SlyD